MRSKSVENFFQRSQSDAYTPRELFRSVLPASPHLFTGPAHGNSSAILPSPSISSTPTPFGVQPRPVQTHFFLEHVFRRPTSCTLCKLIIAGNSKQGLRCKICKMGAHLWCVSEVSEKPCQGKSGMFKRNLSTPVLTNDRLYAVKTQESKAQLDPVYATLRFGTSLANTSRSSFGSFCESPNQSLDEEEGQQKNEYLFTDGEKLTENQEKVTDVLLPENVNSELDEMSKVPKVHPIHTYVALYKFLPQEQNDLELHPGDRVTVIDDSNEEWWKVVRSLGGGHMPELPSPPWPLKLLNGHGFLNCLLRHGPRTVYCLLWAPGSTLEAFQVSLSYRPSLRPPPLPG
ncbi:hypothetical protein QQF64_013568 [Cirrhinus molitorella]|uniref:SH3 and cysteine rich domain 2 n=1 Tax=Cirrhinus molitorella TaxID=172907 RepID=A0ABR3LV48_9TELE